MCPVASLVSPEWDPKVSLNSRAPVVEIKPPSRKGRTLVSPILHTAPYLINPDGTGRGIISTSVLGINQRGFGVKEESIAPFYYKRKS